MFLGTADWKRAKEPENHCFINKPPRAVIWLADNRHHRYGVHRIWNREQYLIPWSVIILTALAACP